MNEVRVGHSINVVRDSNIELLRIIAMFLVLVVHADFKALGGPSVMEMKAEPLASSMRILFQSLSIVCVDTFVLISGWFGIHPKAKSCGKFLFQTYFFLLIFWLGAYVFFGGGES